LSQGVREGDEAAGDRGGARPAVSLDHLAIDHDAPRTERLQVNSRTERAADETLDLKGPAARPSDKALARAALGRAPRQHRGLGVEAGLARNCDDVEEQVTEEILVVDVEREIESRRHEAYAGGALLHSFGGEERWELARNAIEYRPGGLGGLRPPSARSPFQ